MKKRIFLFIWFLLIVYGMILIPRRDYELKNKEPEVKNKIERSDITTLDQEKGEREKRKSEKSNVIFYLSIDSLFHRVPIVQSKDNSYYLNHSIDQKIDPIGSPFLDYRNHWNDKKILIYGHNSKVTPTIFHQLEGYLDPTFYKIHPKIIIEREKVQFTYQIFSILIVTEDYQHMKLNFSQESYKKHLLWLKENSIYNTAIEIDQEAEILILQTCYYKPEDSYLLIAAKKI